MTDLLIEIGCEELPASFVTTALDALPAIVTEQLKAARLSHGVIRPLGTPRRLALIVEGLPDRQPDLDEEVVGPPKSAAFDAEGKPTKAGEGFAKKNGAAAADLRVVKTEKGEYAAVARKEKGRAALDVLTPIVAALPGKIPFAKSMRWGAGDYAFGRPIHWIVALFGGEIVPASFAGVTTGRTTRGHRFLAPATFDLGGASEYVDALKKAHVFVDESERRRTMVERLEAKAKTIGGVLVPDEFLVGENASLVEEPHIVAGTYEPAFLALPEEVIVAVMRGHQRYFAVRSSDGKLMNRYLCVANTALDEATIAAGNDSVMRARLSDARFFVEEDRKKSLADRVPKLGGIVFHAKLGTVGEKVARVGVLAAKLSGDARAMEAATLAKADLVSLIVGEFPELQGLMGRWYAIAEGLDPALADAIRDHYLPKGASDVVPSAALSAHLAVADRADTLVGCFGIGLSPSGSADPFALRRAALGICRIALEGPIDVDAKALVGLAAQELEAQGKKIALRDELGVKLDEFFRTRLRGLLAEKHPQDLVDASIAAWGGGSIRDVAARVSAMSDLRTSAPDAYGSLATAFKRAWNIAKDTQPGDVDASKLVEPAEKELFARFGAVRGQIDAAAEKGEYGPALRLVATELRAPVDEFFAKVFVMAEDTAVRENRLRLLRSLASTLNRIAHFHLLGG